MHYHQAARIADQQRRYMETTALYGPSEALLHFIDPAGSIGSELGLESFDTMSLEEKHRAIMLEIDPDKFDQIACEGFIGTIKKLINYISDFFYVLGKYKRELKPYVGKRLALKKGNLTWAVSYDDMMIATTSVNVVTGSLEKVNNELPSISTIASGGKDWDDAYIAVTECEKLIKNNIALQKSSRPHHTQRGEPPVWDSEQAQKLCGDAGTILTRVENSLTGLKRKLSSIESEADELKQIGDDGWTILSVLQDYLESVVWKSEKFIANYLDGVLHILKHFDIAS